MTTASGVPVGAWIPADAARVLAELARAAHGAGRGPAFMRLLVHGDMGTGKSTLVEALARTLAGRGEAVTCIGADPGSPRFGVPGAACRAAWDGGFRITGIEPLCTLDAARFRLPVARAIGRLAAGAAEGHLIVDAPGVTRGVAGAELLEALVEAAEVETVLVLGRAGERVPLERELAALGRPALFLSAHPGAHRPDAASRARHRTALWDAALAGGASAALALGDLALVGTPPPLDVAAAWAGRQIALFDGHGLLAMGELTGVTDGIAAARLTEPVGAATTLLVRDAVRRPDGLLASAPPPPRERSPGPRLAGAGGDGAALTVEAGPFSAALMNGVFGDPLVPVRRRGARGVILLDLGESAALPPRIAHRVTDVLLTHAHLDHVAGFVNFLRARLGAELPPCRIVGPEGVTGHVAGFIAGVCWDRIGDAGPEFEVGELAGDTMRWTRLKAGAEPRRLPPQSVRGGVIAEEPNVTLRAEALDHRIPVLAYALESPADRRISRDALAASGMAPGPWLRELKQRLRRGLTDGTLELPDGRRANVGSLARELTEPTPGTKLVYATDLADTNGNRRRLIELAKDADVLFLESTFRLADVEQAVRTQHLTTRACGEIATAARVKRLVPFHFSRRYQSAPEAVYAEIRQACGAAEVTRSDEPSPVRAARRS